MEAGGEVTEVSVSEGLLCRDSLARSGLQHHVDEVLGEAEVVQPGPGPGQGDWPVVAELVWPVVWQPGHPWPGLL